MDNKEAVKRLLLLLGRYKKTIVVIVGCLLVSTGLNPVSYTHLTLPTN